MFLHGTMKIDETGFLNIGGLSVKKLVERYGTPLIVFDEMEIKNNINQYLEGLQEYPADSRIIYASKAFSNRTLFRILKKEGLSLDAVSEGELYTALEAGFPPEKIYFHGNNKLPREIKLALENDIGRFVIDNLQEAELLNRMAEMMDKRVKAMIRLTPGIEAHTHEFMITGQLDSKFGVGIENDDALNLVKTIQDYGKVELTGVHAHIGSQIYEEQAYIKLIEIMFSFMDELRQKLGITLSQLDLGGGIGIPQIEGDPEVSFKQYIRNMASKVVEEAEKLGYPLPEICVEPGRSIIGTAGTTLYSVGMIKEIEDVIKYVTIDGGMSDNIRPSLYGADYDAFLANRCFDKRVEKVTIAGKCCESGDILIKDLSLPEAETGDILAVTSTGAYTYALANNYNGIPRPAVVLVNEGEASIIVKRESYDDLLKNDIIPEGY